MEKNETEIKEEADIYVAKAFYIISSGCIAFMIAAYIFAFNYFLKLSSFLQIILFSLISNKVF